MLPFEIMLDIEPTVNNQEDYDEYYRGYYNSEELEEDTNDSPAFREGDSQRYISEMYNDSMGGSRF